MLPEFPSPERVWLLKADLCFCRRWNCVEKLWFCLAPCFAPHLWFPEPEVLSYSFTLGSHQEKKKCTDSERSARFWLKEIFLRSHVLQAGMAPYNVQQEHDQSGRRPEEWTPGFYNSWCGLSLAQAMKKI